MTEKEIGYYHGRTETELRMAQRARHPQAAAAHYKLAAAYLARLTADPMRPARSSL